MWDRAAAGGVRGGCDGAHLPKVPKEGAAAAASRVERRVGDRTDDRRDDNEAERRPNLDTVRATVENVVSWTEGRAVSAVVRQRGGVKRRVRTHRVSAASNGAM